MEQNFNSVSMRVFPPMFLEGLLLGLYAIFWVLLAMKSIELDWLRGDAEAKIIYLIWGLIIFGFCGYRLKKWIRAFSFRENKLTIRTFFSIKDTHRISNEVIVVRKSKKGKTLIKIYSRYCDFLGQFYLDEHEDQLLFNSLDESSIELVEDGVK